MNSHRRECIETVLLVGNRLKAILAAAQDASRASTMPEAAVTIPAEDGVVLTEASVGGEGGERGGGHRTGGNTDRSGGDCEGNGGASGGNSSSGEDQDGSEPPSTATVKAAVVASAAAAAVSAAAVAPSPFEVLDLAADATAKQVKRAFRELAKARDLARLRTLEAARTSALAIIVAGGSGGDDKHRRATGVLVEPPPSPPSPLPAELWSLVLEHVPRIWLGSISHPDNGSRN
jgi:hypothetical protein